MQAHSRGAPLNSKGVTVGVWMALSLCVQAQAMHCVCGGAGGGGGGGGGITFKLISGRQTEYGQLCYIFTSSTTAAAP